MSDLSRTEPSDAATSEPVSVTLFEDRAEVVRRSTIDVGGTGRQVVLVGGLSPYVDDASLQVAVHGSKAKILAAKVVREVDWVVRSSDDDVLEDELRAARERAESKRAAVDRLESDRKRISQLLEDWAGALADAPIGVGEDGKIDAWGDAYDALVKSDSQALQEWRSDKRQHDLAVAALVRAEERYVGTRQRTPVVMALAEVQLDVAEAGSVTLELTYRTPCALWRPEHLARLIAHDKGKDANGRQVEIVTWATVWQITGEHWEDVELVFSTARPSRSASAPLLRDDVVESRRKSAEEQKTITVEARDEAISVTGVDGSARAVDEMPGVDDGGEPLVLSASERASLVSNGQPYRVEVSRIQLDAKLALELMAERTTVAHLKATMTLSGARPLLAGPVRISRGGGLVGRARLDFVAPGEPFEVGFGPDDGLRVQRRADTQRDRVPISGKQKVEKTVNLYLSNLSGDTKSVDIVERVPVSEIEAVDVRLIDTPGWSFDADTGFLKRTVQLDGGATEKLEYVFEIAAKSNVQLPF